MLLSNGDVGPAEAPDQSRGRTLAFSARGDTTNHHGSLQRLLERILTRRLTSGRGPPLALRPTSQNEVAAKRPQLVQDDAGQTRQRKHGLRPANSRYR